MRQEVTKRLPARKRQSHDYDIKKCAVISALKIFATKWKPCIICYLAKDPMRYNDLFRIIPNISRKMLSAHLHELENDGVIIRKQYDPKKQHVEYLLSPKGYTLMGMLEMIQNWGLANIEGVVSIKEMTEVVL